MLVALTLLGGLVLSAVAGVGYRDGVWWAFSVVSTTGFGAGPQTAGGMVTSMVLFIVAVPAYALVVAGAMILAQELNPSVRRSPRPMLAERDVRRVVRDMDRN